MTPATINSEWLRFVPANGIIPLNAECARVLAAALDEADDSFRSQIELECREIHGWYDTNTVETGIVNIAKALAYLEARGLIERHPDQPQLVHLLDQPKVGA